MTVYPRRGDLPPAVVVGEYADGENRVARAIAEMLARDGEKPGQ